MRDSAKDCSRGATGIPGRPTTGRNCAGARTESRKATITLDLIAGCGGACQKAWPAKTFEFVDEEGFAAAALEGGALAPVEADEEAGAGGADVRGEAGAGCDGA